MNEQEIDDLRGIFSESLTPAENLEIEHLNFVSFVEHCASLHPAEYAVCRNPMCRAGFEMEILCDLYKEMNA